MQNELEPYTTTEGRMNAIGLRHTIPSTFSNDATSSRDVFVAVKGFFSFFLLFRTTVSGHSTSPSAWLDHHISDSPLGAPPTAGQRPVNPGPLRRSRRRHAWRCFRTGENTCEGVEACRIQPGHRGTVPAAKCRVVRVYARVVGCRDECWPFHG